MCHHFLSSLVIFLNVFNRVPVPEPTETTNEEQDEEQDEEQNEELDEEPDESVKELHPEEEQPGLWEETFKTHHDSKPYGMSVTVCVSIMYNVITNNRTLFCWY